MMVPAREEQTHCPVHDPLVRITHWGIAAAVLINAMLTEGGALLHIWIGYAAVALLVLRLGWGVIGPDEARFRAFPPSIAASRAHLGDLLAGRWTGGGGRTPLGALMAYALWASLAFVVASGIGMGADPFPQDTDRAAARNFWHDPDTEDDEDESEVAEVLEDAHEMAANLLIVLAAIHVAGVGLESRLAGTNLVRPMLGRRGPSR